MYSIRVFINMILPCNGNIVGHNLSICFSIFSSVMSQFVGFAFFRFSLKYIPKIFVVSSWPFIVIFGVLS